MVELGSPADNWEIKEGFRYSLKNGEVSQKIYYLNNFVGVKYRCPGLAEEKKLDHA